MVSISIITGLALLAGYFAYKTTTLNTKAVDLTTKLESVLKYVETLEAKQHNSAASTVKKKAVKSAVEQPVVNRGRKPKNK